MVHDKNIDLVTLTVTRNTAALLVMVRLIVGVEKKGHFPITRDEAIKGQHV